MYVSITLTWLQNRKQHSIDNLIDLFFPSLCTELIILIGTVVHTHRWIVSFNAIIRPATRKVNTCIMLNRE